MNTLTPCIRCGDIVEFNDITNIGEEFYCDECAYELEDMEVEEE